MKWILDCDNNHKIIVNMQELKSLKNLKLEGIVKHQNGYMEFPCSLEISKNSNSINGLSFKIEKPIIYTLKITPEHYERLSSGYTQEILLNKYEEKLTLIIE